MLLSVPHQTVGSALSVSSNQGLDPSMKDDKTIAKVYVHELPSRLLHNSIPNGTLNTSCADRHQPVFRGDPSSHRTPPQTAEGTHDSVTGLLSSVRHQAQKTMDPEIHPRSLAALLSFHAFSNLCLVPTATFDAYIHLAFTIPHDFFSENLLERISTFERSYVTI